MQKKKIQSSTRWVFYAAVIASLVLLIPTTMNYLEFYVAMNNLYVRADFFSYIEVYADEIIRVNANFSLVHNSSYKGLKLNSIYVALYYEGAGEPLIAERFWFNNKPLDSFSEEPLPFNDVSVAGGIAKNFVELKRTGAVEGILESTVWLCVFGNPSAISVSLDDVPVDL